MNADTVDTSLVAAPTTTTKTESQVDSKLQPNNQQIYAFNEIWSHGTPVSWNVQGVKTQHVLSHPHVNQIIYNMQLEPPIATFKHAFSSHMYMHMYTHIHIHKT